MTPNIITGIHSDGVLDLYVDGIKLNPRDSLKLQNKSPNGFGAGYHGSAPAQSALAILLHVTKNPEVSQRHFQAFKAEYLANPDYLELDHFFFTVDVKAWIEARETEG